MAQPVCTGAGGNGTTILCTSSLPRRHVRTHRVLCVAKSSQGPSALDVTRVARSIFHHKLAQLPVCIMGSCACFAWCDAGQLNAFLTGLPSSVSSKKSPWYHVVREAYHSELELPLNMTEFGHFMFAAGVDAAPTIFDTICATSGDTRAWCGRDTCSAWTSTPMPNISLARKRGALAPWSWNMTQRKDYDARAGAGLLYSSPDKVQHVGREEYLVKVHIQGSALRHERRSDFRDEEVMLTRAKRFVIPELVDVRDHFHEDHTWIEVYRTQTNSSWYVKKNLWEGINCNVIRFEAALAELSRHAQSHSLLSPA